MTGARADPHNTAPPGGVQTPHTYKVGASTYGGASDPSSGIYGYKGDDLRGTHAFAELGMGTALGNLEYGAELIIGYGGKSVTAIKLDIGLGGAPVKGHARRIDLWWETAQALGFSGVGLVSIHRPDGTPIKGPHDDITENPSKDQASSTGVFGIGVGPDFGANLSPDSGAAQVNPIKSVTDFLNTWTSGQGLERLAKIIGGAVLIGMSIKMLMEDVATPTVNLDLSRSPDLTPDELEAARRNRADRKDDE